MYEVFKDFKDLEDKGHIYRAGDSYPREGSSPTDERIESLASENNKRKEALIQVIEAEEQERLPKHTGGGYYEQSNGEKVQGKAKATAAEQALQERGVMNA